MIRLEACFTFELPRNRLYGFTVQAGRWPKRRYAEKLVCGSADSRHATGRIGRYFFGWWRGAQE